MAVNMSETERWQRAAQRALAADLPRQLRQRGGCVVVPSKTTDGTTYHVQMVGSRVGQCDCTAGLAGRPCAHRAAVAIRLLERQMAGARISALKPAGVAAIVRLASA